MIVALLAALSMTAPPPETLKAGVKGKWSAEVDLPVATGHRLKKFGAGVAREKEKALYDSFVGEAKKFFAKPAWSSGEWSYEGGATLHFDTPKVVCFVAGCYQYQGGAHGIGLTRTYSFGFVNGSPKRLKIDDVIGGKVAKKELQMRLLEKAMVAPGTDWIQDGEVKSFTQEQLDRFSVDKKGMTWYFNPYELGSYASGPFEFSLSWKELKGVVRQNGPFASLL